MCEYFQQTHPSLDGFSTTRQLPDKATHTFHFRPLTYFRKLILVSSCSKLIQRYYFRKKLLVKLKELFVLLL